MPGGAGLIAVRAEEQIGTPFKLHGRTPGEALDCIGLVGCAIGTAGQLNDLPRDYHIKGDFIEPIQFHLEQMGFVQLPHTDNLQPGDIIMVRPGPQQQHLMIKVERGFIHAHAGLRRVVMTPEPLLWPVVHCWRLSGG